MKLTVRNYHLDGYGHVNNARYLEFLEEARWTFFKSMACCPNSKVSCSLLHALTSAIAVRRSKAMF